jgi:nucleotide-binding universal stress UspA family protein
VGVDTGTTGPAFVVGLDGSDAARAAAQAAAAWAERATARLVLVRVRAPTPPVATAALPGIRAPTHADVAAQEDADAREALERDREALGLGDVQVRVEVGAAAGRLLAVAGEEDANLVVVGTHGQGAVRAALLGSVVTEVLMDATLPVLAVPAAVDRGATRSVVCGVVDTAESTLAATAAASVAELTGATLVLVHVLQRGEQPHDGERLLGELTAALEPSVEVEPLVRVGRPAEQLTTVADERGSAVIAVGSRGRGAARTLLLGSTTREVLATGRHALLATPPGAVDHVLAEARSGATG